MVKLVYLYIVSLKVSEAIHNVDEDVEEDLLYVGGKKTSRMTGFLTWVHQWVEWQLSYRVCT